MPTCRICGLTYDQSSASDRGLHKTEHNKLAKGVLPKPTREFMKSFGWAVAHADGGLERLKDQHDPEIGKLAVAFSWWSRALSQGAAVKDFDRYMKAHLDYVDALVTGENMDAAVYAIKEWERYAG